MHGPVSNPNANVNLWYDPEAFLSYELSNQIKKFATAEVIDPTVTDPDIFKNELIEKNDANSRSSQ